MRVPIRPLQLLYRHANERLLLPTLDRLFLPILAGITGGMQEIFHGLRRVEMAMISTGGFIAVHYLHTMSRWHDEARRYRLYVWHRHY